MTKKKHSNIKLNRENNSIQNQKVQDKRYERHDKRLAAKGLLRVEQLETFEKSFGLRFYALTAMLPIVNEALQTFPFDYHASLSSRHLDLLKSKDYQANRCEVHIIPLTDSFFESYLGKENSFSLLTIHSKIAFEPNEYFFYSIRIANGILSLNCSCAQSLYDKLLPIETNVS